GSGRGPIRAPARTSRPALAARSRLEEEVRSPAPAQPLRARLPARVEPDPVVGTLPDAPLDGRGPDASSLDQVAGAVGRPRDVDRLLEREEVSLPRPFREHREDRRAGEARERRGPRRRVGGAAEERDERPGEVVEVLVGDDPDEPPFAEDREETAG